MPSKKDIENIAWVIFIIIAWALFIYGMWEVSYIIWPEGELGP